MSSAGRLRFAVASPARRDSNRPACAAPVALNPDMAGVDHVIDAGQNRRDREVDFAIVELVIKPVAIGDRYSEIEPRRLQPELGRQCRKQRRLVRWRRASSLPERGSSLLEQV